MGAIGRVDQIQRRRAEQLLRVAAQDPGHGRIGVLDEAVLHDIDACQRPFAQNPEAAFAVVSRGLGRPTFGNGIGRRRFRRNLAAVLFMGSSVLALNSAPVALHASLEVGGVGFVGVEVHREAD